MSISWDRVRTWSVESAGSIDRDMEVSKHLHAFVLSMQGF
jgi:hypothetical protein